MYIETFICADAESSVERVEAQTKSILSWLQYVIKVR